MLEFNTLPLRELSATPVVLEDGGVPRNRYMLQSLVPEAPNKEHDNPPPPPTFSEADLKAAEQEGYRRGFLEGTKEGEHQARSSQAEIDKQLTTTLADVTEQVQAMLRSYNAFTAEQSALMPQVALAAARKVAGAALDGGAKTVVEALTLQCVQRLLGEPHITITVHESLAPTLEHRLVSHFAGNTDPGEINIVGSTDIAPADCRIEWGFGRAERNTAELWQQVEDLIREASLVPPAASPIPPITPTEGA